MAIEFNSNIGDFLEMAKRHARESIEEGCKTGQEVATARCPVGEDADGQHLRDTIKSKGMIDTGSHFECEVEAGDPAAGIDYAAPVEFGSVHPVGPGRGRPKKEPYTIQEQPFMQPGYEAGKVAALGHAEKMFDNV